MTLRQSDGDAQSNELEVDVHLVDYDGCGGVSGVVLRSLLSSAVLATFHCFVLVVLAAVLCDSMYTTIWPRLREQLNVLNGRSVCLWLLDRTGCRGGRSTCPRFLLDEYRERRESAREAHTRAVWSNFWSRYWPWIPETVTLTLSVTSYGAGP